MKKIILRGQSTYDGAGVELTRIFSHDHTKLTDPFLLLDHFGSYNPDDYVKGFPWHPHRGIETVISGDRRRKIVALINWVCLRNNHLQVVHNQTALSGSH